MIYPAIDVAVEPPGLDTEDDEPGKPTLCVWVALIEGDETSRHAATMFRLPEDVDDTKLADGMVRALLGTARARSPELLEAVLERMRREVT